MYISVLRSVPQRQCAQCYFRERCGQFRPESVESRDFGLWDELLQDLEFILQMSPRQGIEVEVALLYGIDEGAGRVSVALAFVVLM